MTKDEAALSCLAEIDNIKSQFEDYRHKANFERDYLRQVAEQAEAKAKQYRSECVTTMDKLEAAEARAEEAEARIGILEAELLTASQLLEQWASHGVGIRCVAEGVKFLLAERDQLRAALGAVEWVGAFISCPWCGGQEEKQGHKPDCQRQAVLGKEGE